tara:strand:+ start:561 stop:1205 length:645 start_codon:yes stop_codon:yes gene_type:complete
VSDVFQEVDEDIRQERYKTIWKRYRYYFISIIMVLIIAVATNAFLRHENFKKVNERSDKFFNAISISNSNSDEALKLLNEFSKTELKSSQYNVVLSLFIEAAINREKQDFSAALNVYSQIAKMENIDIFYIDYANLCAAETLISSDDIEAATIMLEMLIKNNSPLLLIAKEYLGYVEISKGNYEKSKILFEEIYEDASSSQEMINRVKEVLSVF